MTEKPNYWHNAALVEGIKLKTVYEYRRGTVVYLDHNSHRLEIEMDDGDGPTVSIRHEMSFDFSWSPEEGVLPIPLRHSKNEDAEGPFVGGRVILILVHDQDWDGEIMGSFPIGWGFEDHYLEAQSWLQMDPEERSRRLGTQMNFPTT